jgi:hypothetical protein
MLQSKSLNLAIFFLLWTTPLAAQPSLEFNQLPKEVRDRALEVRNSCKELEPQMPAWIAVAKPMKTISGIAFVAAVTISVE